ncbi:hypothetical protein [Thermococcus sp.]|uniref:hypothetical protein n=1 Tax=Thermococcus sp. TaxID=35749 RepID=UPI0025FF8CA4|nr:hypothetical protein [Thermococcus sp.]
MSSAAIVHGIRWTGEGLSTVQARETYQHVHVVNLLSAGQRGGGKAYMAPGATTVIKLAPPGGAGYIDGGEYRLDIVVGGETECIEDLKIFGADAKDCLEQTCDKKLDILSKPYLEVKIANSDKCMTGISMSIKVSPNYAGLSPLYYDVGLYPLKVKFDRLVQALTCPDFHLDDLKEDVKRSVLAAALDNGDPCSQRKSIGGEKGEASGEVGGYYWTVTDSTFCARSSSDATECAFEIKFNGKEPRVWVEGTENAKTICSDAESYVKDKKEYQQYNLHLIIDGEDCLPDYGVAQKTELSRALKGSDVPLIFLTSCLGTSYICYGITTVATGGISAAVRAATGAGTRPLIECGLGTLATTLATYMSPGFESPQYYPAIPALALGGTAIYKYRNLAQDMAVYRLAKDALKTPHGTEGVEILTGKTADKILGSIGDDSGKLMEYKKQIKSGLEELKKIAKAVGDDDLARNVDDAIKEIDDVKDVEDLRAALKNIDIVLNPTKISHLQKLIKENLENLKKNPSAICSHVGMIAAAASTSLYVLSQAEDVDYLNVAVKPEQIATITIDRPALPNEACISVNGAECPWMR